MKNYYVEIPPRAQADIDGVLDYIAVELCNPQAALNLLDGFIECFHNLKAFPLSGTELKANISLKYFYRWVLVDDYIVLYTVDEAREKVTVMRVLYATSDYLSILKTDDRNN